MTFTQTHLPSRITQPFTFASGRFSGYKKEPDGYQQVRKPIVEGASNPIERLRKLRDELKKMPPEAVYEMLDQDALHARLTFFEAVALAKETGKLMVPNIAIDAILTKTSLEVPQLRTGTIVVYESPGAQFNDSIVHENLTISIPKQFQGKKNCALIVNHPDFNLLRNGTEYEIVVPNQERIQLVEQFPKKDGTYKTDPRTGLPSNMATDEIPDTRYFYRAYSSYIGLLVRDDFYGDRRRGVDAGYWASGRFGVALV